jgi:hypothetical protein
MTGESSRVHLPSVVTRLGEAEYPDAYGGLTARLTGPAGARVITMTIYVVAACAEPFLAAVRAQAARSPGTQYTIVHVPHTWTELNALALRIEDAKDQWRAHGVRLSADPDAAASKVIVTVLPPYRQAAAEALTAAYGHDWISVVPSSARYIPLTSWATRLVTPDGRNRVSCAAMDWRARIARSPPRCRPS